MKPNKMTKHFYRTHLEGNTATIMLWVMILLVGVLSINFVLAIDFDNVKIYDSTTRTATITNNFGMGSEIAKIQLISPDVVYVIAGKNRLVAEFTIESFEDYSTALKQIQFYNNKNNQEFSRAFTYKQKIITQKDVNDYNYKCTPTGSYDLNGTEILTCKNILIGTHKEDVIEWQDFNSKNIQTGKITLGIFTDVLAGDNVEWQPTFYGVKIDEWATWQSSYNLGLIHYWNFEENTGTNVNDIMGAMTGIEKDGTTQAGVVWTTGRVGYGLNATGKGIMRTLGNITDIPQSNYSLTFWVWETTSTGDIFYVTYEPTANFKIFRQTLKRYGWNTDSGNIYTADNSAPYGKWVFLAFTINSTGGYLYVNSTLMGTEIGKTSIFDWNNVRWGFADDGSLNLTGSMDEIGIWNRTLSPTEISAMYNSGAGMSPSGTFPSLISPSANYSSLAGNINFNCSSFVVAATLTNISLWTNSSGSWALNKTYASGGVINSSNFSMNLQYPTLWSCQACDSTGACNFANENRTIIISKLIENSQTYNNQTIEENLETFILNLTYDSAAYPNILSNLIYNKTSYSGTKTGTGNNILFSRTINAPSVTAGTNFTFYWQIGLINSTGTTYYNSTMHNQSVSNIIISGDCTAYSVLVLNYTIKDERTQAIINASIYNSSIEIDMQIYPVGSNSLLMNLSKIYNKTNNAQVCLSENLTNSSQYRLYSQARYYADGYVTRYNYLQNFTMQNSTIPQHINLFDLQSAYATQFLMTYKGRTFLAVANALISINKKYVTEGIFKAVEIEKTDILGQANGYFDLNGVEYQLIVSKEGVILSTFDNIAIFCEDKVVGNCKLNLDASSTTTPVTDFYTYSNLGFTESFNSTTRNYHLIFNTIDSSVANISIFLTKFDGYYNTTLCSNEVPTSSGSLDCSVPASYKNITFTSTIYMNSQTIKTSLWSILPGLASDIWGGSANVVVFVLGIVITLGVMLIPSAIGVIVGTLIGTGFAIILLFISGSIMAGTFIFLVIAGGILIWIISKRGVD